MFPARGLECQLAHHFHVLADTEGRGLLPHNHGRFARGDKVVVPARPFPMLATVVALKKHEFQCAGHFTPLALVYQPRSCGFSRFVRPSGPLPKLKAIEGK